MVRTEGFRPTKGKRELGGGAGEGAVEVGEVAGARTNAVGTCKIISRLEM